MSDPILEQEEKEAPYLLIRFKGEDSAIFDLESNGLNPNQLLLVAEHMRIWGEHHVRAMIQAEARKKAQEKMTMSQIQALLDKDLPKM